MLAKFLVRPQRSQLFHPSPPLLCRVPLLRFFSRAYVPLFQAWPHFVPSHAPHAEVLFQFGRVTAWRTGGAGKKWTKRRGCAFLWPERLQLNDLISPHCLSVVRRQPAKQIASSFCRGYFLFAIFLHMFHSSPSRCPRRWGNQFLFR